jgi:hypothetical protein
MAFASSFKTDCCNIMGGKVFIGPYRAPSFVGAGLAARPVYPIENRDLGEVQMAEITQEVETKERMSHRTPVGGLSCSFSRVKKAALKLKVDCTSAENRALAMLGVLKDVAAGVVAAEPVRVLKNPSGAGNTFVPLQYMIDETVPIVVTNVGGSAPYVLGVDYIVEFGHFFLLDTGAITASLGPAFNPNIEVSYTRRKQQQIESSLVTQTPLVITFAGFSQGGSQGVVPFQSGVRYAKLKPTKVDLITEDYDLFEFEFDLLPDPALQANNQFSPYYWGFFGAQ